MKNIMTLTQTLATFCLFVAIVTGDGEKHWSYSSNHAEGVLVPSKWHEQHPICDDTKQSPVDIDMENVDEDDNLAAFQFKNYENEVQGTWKLKNNGHAAQVDIIIDPDELVMVPNRYGVSKGALPGEYKAVQFHFHWGSTDSKGSEHTVDGKHAPMEVHIVHIANEFNDANSASDKPDGLAVLGSFFEISEKDNPDLEPIISSLLDIKTKGSSVSMNSFPLSAVLPKNRDGYFRYSGSLTTPECYESVVWTVFSDRISISATQLSKFRELHFGDESSSMLVDNYRPVMSLNGRKVKGSPAAASGVGSSHTHAVAAWGGLLVLTKLGTARILDTGLGL